MRQKWNLTAYNISTKISNINGENFRVNYMNVNHLVRLYDVPVRLIHGTNPRGAPHGCIKGAQEGEGFPLQ